MVNSLLLLSLDSSVSVKEILTEKEQVYKNFWTKNVINFIKTIIESTYEHLNTHKIFIQRAAQKWRLALFPNIFCEINIPYPALELQTL